jgi:hypothetical protein
MCTPWSGLWVDLRAHNPRGQLSAIGFLPKY